MAQSKYKVDLQNTDFPMLSEQQTRTVIQRETVEKGDTPGIAYAHNVMPTRRGFDSIDYLQVVIPWAGFPATFVTIRIIYGDERTRLHMAWDSAGRAYILTPIDTTTSEWVRLLDTTPSTATTGFTTEELSVGTVNGISYIYYKQLGAFTYNETTGQLDAVTLTGLTIANVIGLAAHSGYLIAFTVSAYARSSTIDPTDFIPSDVTGAGGADIADIAGDIQFVTTNSLGLLFYAKANIVAATYTGNIQYPFKFKEVQDSKGGIGLDLVAYDANSKTQFAYSKAGLQSITSQSATTILPEVTDFLAGFILEDYNESTKLYEETSTTVGMLKKINYVASRYLVISYGISEFTHAIVLDTALNKLGKLRHTHTECFEYVEEQAEIAKESVAFLTADGQIKVLDFSPGDTSSGVLVLGKIQFSRTRMTQLIGVGVENVKPSYVLDVSSQASLDGKDFTVVEGTLNESSNHVRTYYFDSEVLNHSIAFVGRFSLVTPEITYVIGSKVDT